RRWASTQPARPAAVLAAQPGNASVSAIPRPTHADSIFLVGVATHVLAILPPVGSGWVLPDPRQLTWRCTASVTKPRFKPSFLQRLNELTRRSSHFTDVFKTAV